MPWVSCCTATIITEPPARAGALPCSRSRMRPCTLPAPDPAVPHRAHYLPAALTLRPLTFRRRCRHGGAGMHGLVLGCGLLRAGRRHAGRADPSCLLRPPGAVIISASCTAISAPAPAAPPPCCPPAAAGGTSPSGRALRPGGRGRRFVAGRLSEHPLQPPLPPPPAAAAAAGDVPGQRSADQGGYPAALFFTDLGEAPWAFVPTGCAGAAPRPCSGPHRDALPVPVLCHALRLPHRPSAFCPGGSRGVFQCGGHAHRPAPRCACICPA